MLIEERISSRAICLFFQFCAVEEVEEYHEGTDFGFGRSIKREKKIRELQGNLRAKARKMVTGTMLSGIDFDRPDRPDRLRVFPFDRF